MIVSITKAEWGEKVIRLEKTSFLLFQISMLLTHLPFSYRMSLSYCLSTLFSPVLWIPDYIRHTLDHTVYLLVGASFPSIFFTSTLYLLILVFSNSAFQCSSSYFRSDLPTLWPFRWIFTSMTSFQGVLSIFFFRLGYSATSYLTPFRLCLPSPVAMRRLPTAALNIFQAVLLSQALKVPIFPFPVSLYALFAELLSSVISTVNHRLCLGVPCYPTQLHVPPYPIRFC